MKMAAAMTEELVKDREFGVLYLEFKRWPLLLLEKHACSPSLLKTERIKQFESCYMYLTIYSSFGGLGLMTSKLVTIL